MHEEFEMMQYKTSTPSVRYWQPGGMEVTFCNEPGEGAGVRMSFFTAIAEVREGIPLCRCNMHSTVCLLHVASVACTYVCVCVLYGGTDEFHCCRVSCPKRAKCLTSWTPLKGMLTTDSTGVCE